MLPVSHSILANSVRKPHINHTVRWCLRLYPSTQSTRRKHRRKHETEVMWINKPVLLNQDQGVNMALFSDMVLCYFLIFFLLLNPNLLFGFLRNKLDIAKACSVCKDMFVCNFVI